jgi:hypothetical protein
VVGRSTGPTVDYQLDVAYDDYPYGMSWSLQRVPRQVLFTQSESCDSALVLVRLQRGRNVKTSPREETLMVVCWSDLTLGRARWAVLSPLKYSVRYRLPAMAVSRKPKT